MGTCLITDQIYKRCPIRIGNLDYPADLVKLPIARYDVILGIDWLYQYRAKLDCFEKKVILGHGAGEKSEDDNRPKKISLISAIEAKKLLRGEATGFIAYLLNRPKDQLILEDVEVVNEFIEVFPEHLDSLPPERELEFVIETIPGAEPFSKTLYRMAPAELKELREQLDDLQASGYIRPSTSPWGAPILFVKKKDSQ